MNNILNKWKNSGLLVDLDENSQIKLSEILESIYQYIKDEPSQLYHVALYPAARKKYCIEGNFDINQFINLQKLLFNIN